MSKTNFNKAGLIKWSGLFLALWIGIGLALVPLYTSRAEASLSVKVIAGYNLVVDSNVSSPSTYAPRVATVIGEFCNPGPDPLTDVYGFIGDGTTPGTYPVRNSLLDTEFGAGQKWNYLYNTGNYFFRHVGPTSDASRYIGTIPAGECNYQYWTIEYPACENVAGNWAEPPCTGDPLWGTSVKPDDDLSLNFAIWGTGLDGAAPKSSSASWSMTMRSEISAMANKIEPNGNPPGRWFNTDTDTIRVGEVITTNGVLYRLGNVNKGFDNDGDYVPDYNAWLQPISQPDYDPSCFRLISTSGVLTVTRSGGNPPMIIPFNDTLYFTNLPADNTDVRGEVYYSFLALNGPCNVSLSPYQEAASGSDNEKFNGDYGTGIPPVISLAPEVTISKSSAPNTITAGSVTTYTIQFANNGAASSGLTLSSNGINMPLVISDSVPDGMELAAAATYSISNGITAAIRYSTDSGATWSATAPVNTTSTWPGNKIIIQWWLSDPLPTGGTGSVSFQARVPASYAGDAIIENTACIGLGDADPFACDDDFLKVTGDNTISGTVFEDDGNGNTNNFGNQQLDSGEAGIAGTVVSLYIDVDGAWVLWDTTTAGANGGYSFANLPNGDYRIEVGSVQDTNPGWTNTTDTSILVTLTGGETSADNDFGFAPALVLEKTLVGPNPALEDQLVSYTIDLNNILPGDGTATAQYCEYTFWSTPNGYSSGQWTTVESSVSPELNGARSSTAFEKANNQYLDTQTFDIAAQPGSITKVEVLIGGLDFDILPGTGDQFRAQIAYGGTTYDGAWFIGADYSEYIGNPGLLVIWDATQIGGTRNNAWEWSHFTTSGATQLTLHTTKGGGQTGTKAVIYVDSIGFRVTTDQLCGGDQPSSTINPLPLTDTYDASKLAFVSADPTQTSVTTGGGSPYANTGSINWNNLGPLYAGGTEVVTVTFRVLDGTFGQTITNTATVDNAYFTNGNPTNDATDDASVTVIQTARIGDTIWADNGAGGGTAGNGTQDGGEPGIPGVTVTLTPATDVTIDGVVYGPTGEFPSLTTTTDANGNYLFIGLPLNVDYTVSVTPPAAGFTQTGDPDATLDNQTTLTNLIADVLTADFGYTIPNIITGALWFDYDADAAKDFASGEYPLEGWTVTLTDGTNTWTDTTDANGLYAFYVPDGSYTVTVTPPAGYTQTAESADGAPANVQTCTALGGCNNQVTTIAVSGGNIYPGFDFGYRGEYTVSGTVYADWNANADQDLTGEPGFAGITVSLYDENGNLIATTTTDANGDYSFANLPPGDYTVITSNGELPPGYSQTEDRDESGVCVVCDSKTSVTITDTPVSEVDFGYKPAGSGAIGDTVWRDLNGDGLQAGPGETGIAGVTVWLQVNLNGTWVTVESAVTDPSGQYLFDNLPDDDYRVVVDSSDADIPEGPGGFTYLPSTLVTQELTISGGSVTALNGTACSDCDNDVDFGFTPLGVVGDLVYYDANANGDQDLNETGIAGVEVRLYNDTNQTLTIGGVSVAPGGYISTITSDGSDGNPLGWYQFAGLPSGGLTTPYTYTVQVITSTLPTGITIQTADPDRDGVPCSVNDPQYSACDNETTVLVYPGTVFLGADFGYKPTGVIGDYIWLDSNGDGVQDAAEGPLSFVTVDLYKWNGSTWDEVATTFTDADGYYAFANLADGTYEVRVDASTLPANMAATYDRDDGTSLPDGIVTDIVLLNGAIASIDSEICATDCSLEMDFGYRLDGDYDISGTVFFDAGDNGGLYTLGTDTPYESITVYLWKDGALIGTTTTAADGSYTFANLPDGDYVVSVNKDAPQLSGMEQNTPTPTPYYRLVTISGADKNQEDFGFYAAIDYGDLPESYNTKVASEGAGHIVGDLYLGSGVTTEADGQPDANAATDENDDGIDFDPYLAWTSGVTVSITATVTGNNGYLVGWFDWDVDGSFSEDEMIIFGKVDAGTNDFEFVVPGDAATFDGVAMRFRLYDETTLTYISAGGLAKNGEVEDYVHRWQPTAIALLGFTASPGALEVGLFSAGAALLALTLLFIALFRRMRPAEISQSVDNAQPKR